MLVGLQRASIYILTLLLFKLELLVSIFFHIASSLLIGVANIGVNFY